MRKLQINIYDTDLNWLGMIEEIESFSHRLSWNEIINSELKVSKKAVGINELKTGRILVVNNNPSKALVIEDITTTLVDEFISYVLIPLKGILNWRIVHPLDSGDYVQQRQAYVMTNLVFTQLSATRDVDRIFANSVTGVRTLGQSTPKSYGDLIDFYTPDFKHGYLGDTIIDISKMNTTAGSFPVGWDILINSAWNGYYIETFQATNKTINQTAIPPVVFSDEFANIQNISYTQSVKEWRNVAYMIWKNAGVETNTPVGNTKYGATKSFNRKEIVIESNNVNSTAVVSQGRAELNKRPRVESFTAEVLNNPNTMSTYEKDWFLGDVVTVQSKQLGISIDTQITEVEEIYDNGEFSLNVTFGEGKLTLIKIIKNAIKK